MPQRIDQFLAHAGLGSRKDVRQYIKKKRIAIDGELCTDHGARVGDAAVVTLDGEEVARPLGIVHAIVHKPLGVSCSHDEREAPLLYDLFPDSWRRAGIEAAGRLDRATSGLLVLSNDGNLLHRLIHPKRHIPKRYQITYSGALHREAVARCAAGLRLPDDERPCLPAELSLGPAGQATLVLHEGRFHQVRRMIGTLGAEVTELHRDRIGAFELPEDLEPGAYRPIDAAELQLLLHADS